MEQGGEEARCGDAGDADGNVGGLDTGEKRHPVQGEDRSAACDFQEGLPADSVQPSHDPQGEGERSDADHHPVPDEREPAQRDQAAENARPPGQEHGEVEDDEDAGISGFLHGTGADAVR